MKRFLIIVTWLILGFITADARSGLGLRVGMNNSSANAQEISQGKYTGLQVGVAYNLDLPLGLSIQPALQYNIQGTNYRLDSGGYLEFMTSVQWGLDLIIFRPFIDFSPFVGYAVNGDFGNIGCEPEFGLGVGLGLDLWGFQFIWRYNWNFDAVTLSLAYFF